jgi:hypothetical protein
MWAEWGMVSVTEDLMAAARELSQLASEFRTEARAWTHPAARAELGRMGAELVTMSQAAAIASSSGDYWDRLEAVQLAQAQLAAGRLTLRKWFDRGELWNSHRLRPVPASIARGLA